MEPPRFVALVPVKPPAVGKSRLRGVSTDDRVRLAAGFALDTVTACLATRSVAEVICVTDDAGFAARLADAGCAVIPDGVAGDLNESLRLAALEAARRWPALVPVAVCADLPALAAPDLESALGGWAGAPRFVADTDGSGTTLYAAPTADFLPSFGPGSGAAHRSRGVAEVTGDLPTLRRDVDDVSDLRAARALGLGPHTDAVVRSLLILQTH